MVGWTTWREQGGGSHSINLSGAMDEAVIFAVALSADDIQKVHNATQRKVSKPR